MTKNSISPSMHDKHKLGQQAQSKPKEKMRLQWGPYSILELTQDERVVYFSGGKVFRGLDVSGDIQSDSLDEVKGAALANAIPGLLRALLTEHIRGTSPLDWDIEDLSVDIEYPIDSDLLSDEAEHIEDCAVTVEDASNWDPDRLTDMLINLNADRDWSQLRDLILLAEDTDFTPEQSALLAPRLLDLATRFRESHDPQDEPPVWSAIRTGASMLYPDEADRLLPLLEPGHPIETSLVALKMLGRIFEAQPPNEIDQYPILAGKVRGIADLLLNRYAISSTQSAAMAQLAIYALAAMASNKILDLVQVVRDLNVTWFRRQTFHELAELRDYWNDRPTGVAPEPQQLLERILREIQAE